MLFQSLFPKASHGKGRQEMSDGHATLGMQMCMVVCQCGYTRSSKCTIPSRSQCTMLSRSHAGAWSMRPNHALSPLPAANGHFPPCVSTNVCAVDVMCVCMYARTSCRLYCVFACACTCTRMHTCTHTDKRCARAGNPCRKAPPQRPLLPKTDGRRDNKIQYNLHKHNQKQYSLHKHTHLGG